MTRSWRSAPRTVGALALLAAALPVNLAVTGAALVYSGLVPAEREMARTVMARQPRTVLISGGKMTKALALARAFHRAGHRVVLVETHRYRFTGHRFSRAVAAFHVVPAPDAPDYVQALLRIVEEEGVDVYVPVCSPAASRYDADAGDVLAGHCEVLHLDPATLRRVDDKDTFVRLARSLGLDVPETHRVTDARQVADFDFAAHPGRSYILKSIAYDPVRRRDLTPLPRPTPAETESFAAGLPISPDNPWILQEFVHGQEFCTHATVRGGRLRVHACCESSPVQLNYAHVRHPEIEDWVRRFVAGVTGDGQISLDLMVTPDGRVVGIECNPRTHSAITMFHDHPDLARAYLEDGAGSIEQRTIEPLPGSRPIFWLYQELGRMLADPRRIPERMRVLRDGTDAIFDAADPLPFLLVHHLSIPWLLLVNLLRGRDWVAIDVNIGKLVEPAGD